VLGPFERGGGGGAASGGKGDSIRDSHHELTEQYWQSWAEGRAQKLCRRLNQNLRKVKYPRPPIKPTGGNDQKDSQSKKNKKPSYKQMGNGALIPERLRHPIDREGDEG